MADNIAITPGSGATIKTDEIDGTHVQFMKLMDGADAGDEAIGGDAANGLDVDVTRLPTLPAGTNNIGDVDVLTLPITQPLTDTELRAADVKVTLDSEEVTANLGATDNAVLDDIASNQTDASQKSQIVDGSGNVIGATDNALDVNIKSGSSAGTEYTEGDTDASITGVAILWEDAADTLEPVSADKPLPVEIKNTTIDCAFEAGTEIIGKVGIDQVTANANEVVVKSALPAGTNAIGKLAANSGVDIGDVDVLSLPSLPAGTNAIGKLAANSGVDIGDVDVTSLPGIAGTVAHDSADSGNPVKVGAKVKTALSGITPAAADDRTDLYADEDGVLIVKQNVPNNDILCERVSNTDGAAAALTVFGATANCYNMITTIIVHNSHATTNGYVDLLDGSGGTIIMTIPLPAGGGAVINLPVPLRQPTVNTALYFDVSAAISTVFLSFVGYKSKA